MENSQDPGCPEQREAGGKVKEGKKISSTVSEVKAEVNICLHPKSSCHL